MIELTRCTTAEYHRIDKLPLRLMADNVRSAMNIGAMLRTSDAFLVREMIMAGISATPPSAEISKTALGAEESVAWRHVDDAVAEARRLKEAGVFISVLEQTHNS
ncbi:MAG: TrmH family RNA methyltransferase, partial [Muribaculaceae bacterium]|nr:TrmH family RNA methyltransferase [Muribaculaceae bacterium]